MSDTSNLRNAALPLLAALPGAVWLPHKLVRKPDGALDKPPCEGARTNAPETWFTLEAALAKLSGVNDVAGIGFAVVKGIIALDFDHCRDPFTGILDDEVQTELERLNSYAYVTPSKAGIRVVGLNDPGWPIQGNKHNRWLPGGHKIEIFIGPCNFYNTFTSDLIAGYGELKDVSGSVLDYLEGLDAGPQGKPNGRANGATPQSNPEPQRSVAAIRAALAVIPNTTKNWDEWCRIGMAVWRSCGGSGDGLDAWSEWSSRLGCHDQAKCDERWQHWFESPPTKIGFGSLYYEARKNRPLFVPPFDLVPASNGHDSTEPPHPEQQRTRILTMRELDALPPPEWIVHGLIPDKSLVVPFGPPKSGKTFIVLSFCLHVAAGKPWFGHPVRQGAVVYIAGEGTSGLSLRLKAMRAKYEIGIDAPLWVVPRAVNFRLEGEVQALVALVKATVGDVPVRLVIIDTLARAMPGADENSAQEVGLVIAGCDEVRDALGCTTVPIHHSGKDATRGARGTSALRGAWDTALEITASGKRVTMLVADQKEAESGQRLVFRMEQVAVGIGRSSLVPVLADSVDIEADEGAEGRQQERYAPTGQAGTALQVLRNIVAGPDSAILPPFSGIPSGDVRGVDYETWRRGFYEKMPGETQAARRVAFNRAKDTLLSRGWVGVRDPWVWLV